MSGWLVLISFIPSAGGLFTLVISLIPGQPGANQYGPAPGTSQSPVDVF